MRTISNLRDLQPFGIIPLTGEACGLGLRVLCDVTERGRKILASCWGIPDLQLPEPWNRSTDGCAHVGSVMLDPDAYMSIGIFALLNSECSTVLRFYPRHEIFEGFRLLKQTLRDLKIRIHFIGAPGEPKRTDGTPDWRKEIAALELAQQQTFDSCLLSSHILYGFAGKPEDNEECAGLLELVSKVGWTYRCFRYSGTAGDRNKHVLSGRVR